MTESVEHSIEYVNLGGWQNPDLLLARCACGWESQRTAEQVVQEEVRRHVASGEEIG
jgi:hypothetical protein